MSLPVLEVLAVLGYVLAARNTYVWCTGTTRPVDNDELAVALAAVWPVVWLVVGMMVGWDWLVARLRG